MQQIRVKVQAFDLKRFYMEMKKFVSTQINPELDTSAAFNVVEENGNTPDFAEEDPDRDILQEILTGGKTIFFPFSGPGCEFPIPCANGEAYYEEQEDEDGNNFVETILGETDVAGFLVRVEDGYIVFDSAIHFSGSCGMPPSASIDEELDLFNEPMREFVLQFVRK